MINLGNSYRRYALTVSKINEYAKLNPQGFVDAAETAYRADIRDIAQRIIDSRDTCRVVLLAGPSASGKTTTAKMLAEELENLGSHAEIISMDNFYLGRANVPKTELGEPDFECVEALNIAEVKNCITALLGDGECDIPTFNFAKSEPFEKKLHLSLAGGKIAIFEGIHALNPIFTNSIPSTDGLKKIYISVKQGIHRDAVKGYHITASELRLLRRLVRDYKFRGASAEHTLGMWENVLRGEKKYIVPFKYKVDITINSIHIYEPCITASEAVEILERVSPLHREYGYAQDLIERAKVFVPMSESYVPDNSLMREFIGNGKYKY